MIPKFMSCVSSKMLRGKEEEEKRDIFCNHVVFLTSSTYGCLKLDKEEDLIMGQDWDIKKKISPPREIFNKKRSSPEEIFEVINTWELMKDLYEEEAAFISNLDKNRPTTTTTLLQPSLKIFNQMASPKRAYNWGGKENKVLYNGVNSSPKLRCVDSGPNLIRKAKDDEKGEVRRGNLLKRRSLSPLFGVLSADKEVNKEKVASGAQRVLDLKTDTLIWDLFEKKCPRGGDNSVVIYTTTLRGIRKTYEDCNKARLTLESHGIQIFERDVSMHKSFKEDLRNLMGTKEVKVPIVFVKGILIGGADVVIELEEEGKLGTLLEGIPSARAACRRCEGVQFVICLDCNGSCKVLGDDKKNKMKCVKCNENGLIQCLLCC